MKLLPYPSRDERWRKTCKHVFNQHERWWEIFGDLPKWQQDWTTLRARGVFHREEGHLAIAGDARAEAVADRNHDAWLAAADRASDEARAAGRVSDDGPGRRCYIGDAGVVVIVARGWSLVTCYRPGGGRSRTTDQERVRGAVRRQARRASLQATRVRHPDKETDDAS